ncbi:uncharacterized protein [Eurosta solidaginis]|uniref:uncharacterized protein n=1 Tax=Eurosta solidaginis TaxID=178769 RepID=UPI003530D786
MLAVGLPGSGVVGIPDSGSIGGALGGGGATSPTTSTASAGIVGCGSGSSSGTLGSNIGSGVLLGSACNTLPHPPSSAAAAAAVSNVLAAASATCSGVGSATANLNRNLVILRNHLRKNTNTTPLATVSSGGVPATGVATVTNMSMYNDITPTNNTNTNIFSSTIDCTHTNNVNTNLDTDQ